MPRMIPPDISEIRFDAIIIGAGINGAGIARDASLRGLKVLLLDKGDVASGTSAWSTRLIHGGLRYLEHGELGLVRESLRERETLLRIAPHLVRPLPLLIPIYGGRKRGRLLIRAGMTAYDVLSFDKTLPRHRMLTRAETLRRAPALEAENLKGAALYYDAQVEFAERLVLENALDARAHGAVVLTRARVERIMVEGEAVRGVEFRDLLGGATYEARAPLVLNVSGPWVDDVLERSGLPRAPRLIGGTKGSHIVVETIPGSPVEALYAEAHADARPFFIIPWNNLLLIGTTDTRYEGDLDGVVADEREIDYLLDETNRLLPRAQLTREHVLYTYAGVRPLPFTSGGRASGITRRHFVRDDAPAVEGFISVVGGKLTTYRSLSEEAVDMLFKKLGRRSPACETAHRPLPGARVEDFKQFVETFRAGSKLTEASKARLLKIYGARAPYVLQFAAKDAELGAPLVGAAGASLAAEVLFSFEVEMAETLGDCLLRRMMAGLNRAAGLDEVEAAARVARKYLGWDERRAAREVADYRRHVARFYPRRLQNQTFETRGATDEQPAERNNPEDDARA